MSKIVSMPRAQYVNELADAHMRGYSQGTITGLELAERMTGMDLSEAKKVVLEEARKDAKNNGNIKEADIDRRTAAAVKRPQPGEGGSPGGNHKP